MSPLLASSQTGSIAVSLAMILVIGVGSQWLAWRVGLPSILLLLTAGIIAGPWQGWLEPDKLFGDLLLPCVSLAVALILYEGGLSLKVSELKKVGAVVRNLVTIGAAVSWVGSAAAAHFVLGLSLPLSSLLGAVLVVTGPTVIGPLLRHIRPTGAVGSILKWEGIVIDPIGALLAVLIFEALVIGRASEAAGSAAISVAQTIFFGGGIGAAAALLLTLVLAKFWLADHLQNAVSLMLVIAAFTVSNLLQEESGLLAVTVMGFVLANQKKVDVAHIVEFKENLQVLLISSLFVILAARLKPDALTAAAMREVVFVVLLILIVRPVSVFASTIRTKLSMREKLFLSWMAPRGIVAAAVSSVFALKLAEKGYAGADRIVPITFSVIIATVGVYGLTASFVARWLKLAESNPQGILFVGAQEWVQQVASLLKEKKFRVYLVDNNWENVNEARMHGLPTYAGSILDEKLLSTIDLGGIGRILALTPNDWVNSLALKRFEHVFGKANCYQLPPEEDTLSRRKEHGHIHGRLLFDDAATYDAVRMREFDGFTIKATRLSEEFTYENYQERYRQSAMPMFVIDAKNRLNVITAKDGFTPESGHTIIGFVKERKRPEPSASKSTKPAPA
ncbi:MAG: sodium:proton antiporter [Phycisphaerales bacterium]|nr:sodium:proton antiporter [Phycisphaerales bacterium]MCB9856220.1 sodium:proton antiporter [Phycisphaerales bacterium]MCB9863341.1 sodium:proton antiporter [Phycisphaerales bacterium]